MNVRLQDFSIKSLPEILTASILKIQKQANMYKCDQCTSTYTNSDSLLKHKNRKGHWKGKCNLAEH
jgi:hypothetical protein